MGIGRSVSRLLLLCPGGRAKHCDQRICMSAVCLYVHVYVSVCLSARISQHHTSKFHQIFCTLLRVVMARSSLCTSDFVDDVVFSHNGANRPQSKTTRMVRAVCPVVAPGAKSAVSDCISFCHARESCRALTSPTTGRSFNCLYTTAIESDQLLQSIQVV